MIKQFFAVLSFALVPLTGLFAQDSTSVFTLEQAIEYAKTNSINIKIAQKNIEDAEAQIIERRATGLPQLNATVNLQRYLAVPKSQLPEAFAAGLPPGASREVSFVPKYNINAVAEASTLIFDGAYLTALEAAKVYREYANHDLTAQERTIQNQVIEAYLPSLIVDENVKILDKNIANLSKMLTEVKATYDAGFVEQLDVDRLTLSLANLKTEVDNLNRQKELALNYLKFVMGYPIDEKIEIADNLDNLLTPASPEDLTSAINYTARPEYIVAQTGLRLNELNLEATKKGYLPSVAGFVNFQYGYQGDNFKDGFWSPLSILGLKATMPIFDGFGKKAKLERAEIAIDLTKERIKLLENSISLEIQNARTSYLTALERTKSQEKNLGLAEKIYKTTQTKYSAGVGSSIEVTQAEQSLYDTQRNYIQARYQLLVAKRELDTVLGKK